MPVLGLGHWASCRTAINSDFICLSLMFMFSATQQRVVCVHLGQWDTASASVTVLVLSMSLLSTLPGCKESSFNIKSHFNGSPIKLQTKLRKD